MVPLQKVSKTKVVTSAGSKYRLFPMALVFVFGMAGCATERTNPPPQGEIYQPPWGAVNIEAWDAQRDDIFSEEIVALFADNIQQYQIQNPGQKFPYRMLALSGGGSRGAYGAGVLAGWSRAGTRPQFGVVTGVSTGALLATPAFLGVDYDAKLELFTRIENEDVYRANGRLAIFTREGLFDTTPLRELLASEIDDAMIEAVAQEYRKGRALFIGTTNLDAKVFTIWDMGKIASSNRPDKAQLYRDIILASASFPVAFPPVYLPVTTNQDETYYQMHSDGGIRESVFVYDFIGELKEKLDWFNLQWDKHIDAQIYLLNNGKMFEDETYRVVNPNTISIAMRSMYTLMRSSTVASIYSVWVMSLAHNATVNLAFIPEDYDLSLQALNFDREKMKQLYQYGYDKSINGQAWLVRKPPADLEEFRQSLDLIGRLNPLNPSRDTGIDRTGFESVD